MQTPLDSSLGSPLSPPSSPSSSFALSSLPSPSALSPAPSAPADEPVLERPARPRSRLSKLAPVLILLPTIALALSFAMTWGASGFGEGFMARWARGFGASVCALPVILAFVGFLEAKSQSALSALSPRARKAIVAVISACVIESVLALAVSCLALGAGASLGALWWGAFSRSLPLGLCVSFAMCFVVKPKIDALKNRP